MTKRMLIDCTHAEETRVVVLDGSRLEDYDVETSTKQQLKGNIYLAKVVRVEPSLQAAFVEYGGNRHGFLAFGEIHPDYYQIPVADRQRLLEMQEAEAREEEEAEERAARRGASAQVVEASPAPALMVDNAGASADAGDGTEPEAVPEHVEVAEPVATVIEVAPAEAAAMFPDAAPPEAAASESAPAPGGTDTAGEPEPAGDKPVVLDDGAPFDPPAYGVGQDDLPADAAVMPEEAPGEDAYPAPAPTQDAAPDDAHQDAVTLDMLPQKAPEQLGGEPEDSAEDSQPERVPSRFMRNYKIQEVIRRRQILLVQVVKEERGTKGAALTTYISLAGRFSVLMPNSPRGGGISRKITSAADRRRLKEITAELELPRGMGLIVRTAGANRPKPEIIRDCEYLLNQWDQIRELTMKSMAPALIYEEASLIKRAIRDVYSRDVDDILVDGEAGWRAARDFMRMLMPTHAKKVQLWKEPQPLFAKAQVEQQLDAMLQPTVQLKSGGYLVINQTEALVAIDVNSGRSTRERGIEETALRTNLEAAEEAARQLRLRDLAGLIVIDFIDMESRRNNAAVEKKLKEALKDDRARIQLGSISHFGLLEMSRQRLRPSLAETSFMTCPHCNGTGSVRSTESAALHVLRAIEEEGAKRRAAEIVVHVAGSVALYILNHKRVRLQEVEQRFGMAVTFAADDSLLPPNTRIDRVRAADPSAVPAPISQLAPPEPFEDPDEEALEPATDDAALEAADPGDDDEAPRPGETAEEGEQRRRRRRRRRRGGRREDGTVEAQDSAAPRPDEVPTEMASILTVAEDVGADAPEADGAASDDTPAEAVAGEASAGEDAERSKRRGRRGGRRRRREPGDAPEAGDEGAEAMDSADAPQPAYAGPTPANPFGGAAAFDIFDAIEQEQERAMSLAPRTVGAAEAAAPALSATEMTEAVDAPAAEPEAPVEAAAEAVADLAPAPVKVEPEVAMADAMPDAFSPGESPASEPAAVAKAEEAPAEPVAAAPEPDADVQAPTEPAPPPAPVIAPVLVGTVEPTQRKQGWWKR